MSGKWLGRDAILWALDEAPDVPPSLVSTLVAVARYADERGEGSRAAASEIARMTRKSERQAQRDLAELEKRGLLRRGDQSLAAHIPANFRPNVFDLPLDTSRVSYQLDTSPTSYLGKLGTTPVTDGYDTGDASIRHPRRTTRSRKDLEQRASRARAGGADASTPENPHHPRYSAPPCPVCGKPFSQEQLADPEFRAMALAGEAVHVECIEREPGR